MNAVISRLNKSEGQTLGHFSLFDDTEVVFQAKSLELPDLNNQNEISCIPAGKYKCVLRNSEKYGDHFLVQERDGEHVRGRKWILIHFGNYKRDIKGCILLGSAHTDIDGDGLRDVTSSQKTVKRLVQVAGPEFNLTITDV